MKVLAGRGGVSAMGAGVGVEGHAGCFDGRKGGGTGEKVGRRRCEGSTQGRGFVGLIVGYRRWKRGH